MAPKRKSDCNEASSPSKQQKVQPAEISMIERSKLVDPNISGRRLCTIISWNVAGIRGILKNNPSIFTSLLHKHSPDILCLQETKIQDIHESDFTTLIEGYESYWCSSTTKKGYSGTAIFVRKSHDAISSQSSLKPASKPQKKLTSFFGKKKKGKDELDAIQEVNSNTSSNVVGGESLLGGEAVGKGVDPADYDSDANHITTKNIISVKKELDDPRFCGEGRTLTVEFDKFYLVNCYVPNSGQNLERLTYRVEEWDSYFHQYLTGLERLKPVILTGDLNVAHLDIDIYNFKAKHIEKQSGTTPQERESFSALLGTTFQDALRYFHPDALGQFTWWSVRTNARPVNKGLRLDYYLVSKTLLPSTKSASEDKAAADSISTAISNDTFISNCTILTEDTIGISDHCPILLDLKQH